MGENQHSKVRQFGEPTSEPAKRFTLHSSEISGQSERSVQMAVARIKALGEDPEADADLVPAPDDKPEVRREKAIERHAREVARGVEAHKAITAANKVTGVELDAIAKLPVEDRFFRRAPRETRLFGRGTIRSRSKI